MTKLNDSVLETDLFAGRMRDVPRSFIREILKVATSKKLISFAGGLPNPKLFPVNALGDSAQRVLQQDGGSALQYGNTEGYLPLREYIASFVREKQGVNVSVDNILITSGSQQGLDLLGKIFLDPGDEVIIEEPGYLGAIQAFSLFEPRFHAVPLKTDGIDTERLKATLSITNPKMIYTVPDFQNPSGISYSEKTREAVVKLLRGKAMHIIEDTPYNEIRFGGNRKKSFLSLLPEQTIQLGTFSKTAVPGFRLGWVVASEAVMEKLVIAKQAADLHTNSFTQQLLHDYLVNNPIQHHIDKIAEVYGRQCQAMLAALKKYMPSDVQFTQPEGGMFLWAKLPGNKSSMKFFNEALKLEVAFVPGNPFYVNKKEYYNTLRLNFSCSDEETIEEGVKRLATAYKEL